MYVYICIHVYVYCTLLTFSIAKNLHTILTYMYICIYYTILKIPTTRPCSRSGSNMKPKQSPQPTDYSILLLLTQHYPALLRITLHDWPLDFRPRQLQTMQFTHETWLHGIWPHITPLYCMFFYVTDREDLRPLSRTTKIAISRHEPALLQISPHYKPLDSRRGQLHSTKIARYYEIWLHSTSHYCMLLYWPLRSQTIVLCCGSCPNMWPKQSPN